MSKYPDRFLGDITALKALRDLNYLAWGYVHVYKPASVEEKEGNLRLSLFTEREISIFKSADARPEVAQVFNHVAEHQLELQKNNENMLRIFSDGRQMKLRDHDRLVIEGHIRESTAIMYSNIFGAAGVHVAEWLYPDDVEKQDAFAHSMATAGELFFTSGEVLDTRHEYHNYRPGDPYQPMYAPGHPEDRPSLEPLGHDVPGSATYNPNEPGEAKHGDVGQAESKNGNEHLDLQTNSEIPSGIQEAVDAGGSSFDASGQSGTVSEQVDPGYNPDQSQYGDASDANMTAPDGSAVHAGDYDPGPPTPTPPVLGAN